jgi:hypothetical protein
MLRDLDESLSSIIEATSAVKQIVAAVSFVPRLKVQFALIFVNFHFMVSFGRVRQELQDLRSEYQG